MPLGLPLGQCRFKAGYFYWYACEQFNLAKGALLNTHDEYHRTPRVLGVDDWAFRKGNTYGIILVDLESNKPVDLLPDREAGTLEKWLKSHPGVEIISRDRAGSYAQGAGAGAPGAVQVADRWHLLKNLGDALKRMLDKHNRELRLAAEDIAEAKRKKEVEAQGNDKRTQGKQAGLL